MMVMNNRSDVEMKDVSKGSAVDELKEKDEKRDASVEVKKHPDLLTLEGVILFFAIFNQFVYFAKLEMKSKKLNMKL